MQPLSVVIASTDSNISSRLAESLNHYFRSVSFARSAEEVRHAIPKHRAQFAIVDLEAVSLRDVQQLCRDFGSTQVVCTHRIPDEEMWMQALAAGAIDCCHNADFAGIVNAVQRNNRFARGNAA